MAGVEEECDVMYKLILYFCWALSDGSEEFCESRAVVAPGSTLESGLYFKTSMDCNAAARSEFVKIKSYIPDAKLAGVFCTRVDR